MANPLLAIYNRLFMREASQENTREYEIG